MRKKFTGALAALTLAGAIALGSAGSASAAGFGEHSPGKWQSGEGGYALGCAVASLWGVKCG
ncbi:hypothetical protein J2Z21_006559 [Streptomyces griseochromogenes]|uniref:Uncharacterized protein n=1 Tax=Streptomyces griseochromogenes TaxID=68214 RepID=A0A1B1B9I8_9ACTN|nr:hypothetical protein [Streptomyces griseochromogenes]ANP55485.1 hypothetical protein AVL59_43060 [Streptomyces griseochromogenes]MBP2053566.1 hypothetical protein [Streptomyces griseochromogenes]